jgi:Concanavalin A-like lectin/glucanases superfamily/PEP-CTERM motif
LEASTPPMKKHILSLLVAVGLIGSASAAIDNWTFGNGDLANGLVSFYSFNGNANDSVSGNNLIGNDPNPHTLYNAGTSTFVSGSPSLAADMFGNQNSAYRITYGQYLENNNMSFSFSTANNYTFSFWSSVQSIDDRYLFLMRVGATDGSSSLLFLLDKDNGNQFSIQTTGANEIASSITPEVNRWYLNTVTISNGDIRYYIDGSVKGTSIVNTISSAGTPTQLLLGNEFWWFQANDTITDVGIWNRALSSSEVSQLYTLQSAPEPSTYALFGIGAIGMLIVMRSKKIA